MLATIAMLPNWNVPFRALVDAAPDGLVVCDATGGIVVANAEAERMFGYGHDELLGKSIELLLPERVQRHHHHHVASYTAAPRLRPMGGDLDLRARRKDGAEFPVEISLSPITSDRGLLIIAGVRDVSERRRLEHEHKRSSAYLASAVEAVQEAFLLFDEHDRLILMNSAARALTGQASDAPVIGRRFEDLLRDSLAAKAYDLGAEDPERFYARRLAYHHAPSGAIDLRTVDGRYLRMTDRKTAEHGTVTMIADVTGDVQRTAELGAAREQAEAASAAKSEFLSSMSHELRTPLNAILGFAQLLERDRKRPLDDRQLERVGYVLRGGEHLLRLIDDVLDLARIEAGRIAMSSEPVDVGDLLAEVAHTLEPMAARAQIELAVEPVSPDVPSVVADRTRLAQILMNLGSNAIKYGKPLGHVTLRAELGASALRLVVIDDGVGIPDDKRDVIFEPFQRAGQETGPIEGTGIGLTISRRLAHLMHGTIDFTSDIGAGSRFWIELPLHRATVAPRGPREPSARAAARDAASAARLVIYVEDNPSNIAFMRDVIDQLPGVELMSSPTAEIGLDLIRRHLPKLVIMDINLPGMNGFEALNRLRGWPETREIPVIALSAAALAKDTTRGESAGFHRYLTKPVKLDELMDVLEELLDGTRARR